MTRISRPARVDICAMRGRISAEELSKRYGVVPSTIEALWRDPVTSSAQPAVRSRARSRLRRDERRAWDVRTGVRRERRGMV